MNDKLLMTYFTEEGTTFFAYGETKGTHWTPVRPKSFLCPQNGNHTIRDPFLGRGLDGKFRILFTESWWGKAFGHVSSEDLLHWSEQKNDYLMMKVEGCKGIWAPEFFCDPVGKEHMVYWTAIINNRPQIWYSHTKDFFEYMPPRVLFDPGFPVIDATIIFDGKRYIMAFKDESKEVQAIRLAFADNLLGPYKNISRIITPPFSEGPILMKVGDEWHLYFDKFKENSWGLMTTTNFIYWKSVPLTVPHGARHGSICLISQWEMNRLLASNKALMMA